MIGRPPVAVCRWVSQVPAALGPTSLSLSRWQSQGRLDYLVDTWHVALPGSRIIGLALGKEGPDHAGMLVSDRHQRLVVTHTSGG